MTKILEVEADNEQQAGEIGHERFSVLPDKDEPEHYRENLDAVEQID